MTSDSRDKSFLGLDSAQLSRLKAIAVAAALVALVPFMLNANLEARCSHTLLETDDSAYYLPSEQFLIPMSLGYREAAAGIVWARLLVYFGEQHEVRGHFEHLEPYLIGVTRLDPYFYRAYTWGSMASIYNGTIIDRAGVEMSIRMLEAGLEYFPDDGDLHYFLGFQFYTELAPLFDDVGADAEAEAARRRGTDEICTGALLGGGPPYLPLVCANLAARGGMADLARERLVQTYLNTEDERTRQRIVERLEQLTDAEAAFSATRRLREHRLRWRAEMPYAPGAFYVIAGPRPVMPLEDQVELPLPMDGIIRAQEETYFYQVYPDDETEATARDREGEGESGAGGGAESEPEAEAEP